MGYPSEFGQNDLVITLSCLEWVISRHAATFTRSTFILRVVWRKWFIYGTYRSTSLIWVLYAECTVCPLWTGRKTTGDGRGWIKPYTSNQVGNKVHMRLIIPSFYVDFWHSWHFPLGLHSLRFKGQSLTCALGEKKSTFPDQWAISQVLSVTEMVLHQKPLCGSFCHQ